MLNIGVMDVGEWKRQESNLQYHPKAIVRPVSLRFHVAMGFKGKPIRTILQGLASITLLYAHIGTWRFIGGLSRNRIYDT